MRWENLPATRPRSTAFPLETESPSAGRRPASLLDLIHADPAGRFGKARVPCRRSTFTGRRTLCDSWSQRKTVARSPRQSILRRRDGSGTTIMVGLCRRFHISVRTRGACITGDAANVQGPVQVAVLQRSPQPDRPRRDTTCHSFRAFSVSRPGIAVNSTAPGGIRNARALPLPRLRTRKGELALLAEIQQTGRKPARFPVSGRGEGLLILRARRLRGKLGARRAQPSWRPSLDIQPSIMWIDWSRRFRLNGWPMIPAGRRRNGGDTHAADFGNGSVRQTPARLRRDMSLVAEDAVFMQTRSAIPDLSDQRPWAPVARNGRRAGRTARRRERCRTSKFRGAVVEHRTHRVRRCCGSGAIGDGSPPPLSLRRVRRVSLPGHLLAPATPPLSRGMKTLPR